MARIEIACCVCGKKPLSKDEIGLNKKLIAPEPTKYYCLDCMSDYLDVSIGDLYDKIQKFKEAKCIHFM